MSDRQRLRDILRPGVTAVIRPRNQARLATISSAFDRTGRPIPGVIGQAIVQAVTVDIPGAAVIGTDVAMPRRMPQSARIQRLDAIAKTPPSGGEFTASLYADGVYVANVSIASGQAAGSSPSVNVTVPAGAVLRWDVNPANGAADVALSAVYAST